MKYLKYYEAFVEVDVKQIDDSVADRDSLYSYEDNEEVCIDCEEEKKEDESDLSDDITDLEEQEEPEETCENVNSYEVVDRQDVLTSIILKFSQDFGRMPLFKLQNVDNDAYLEQELIKITDEFFEDNDFDESYKNDFVKYLMAEWANMYADNIQPAWDKGTFYKKTIM